MRKLSTLQALGTDSTLLNWTFHGGAPTDLGDPEGPNGFWWKEEPVRDLWGAVAAICKAGGESVADGIAENESVSQVLRALLEVIRRQQAPAAATDFLTVYVDTASTGDGSGRDTSNRMSHAAFAEMIKYPRAAAIKVILYGGTFAPNFRPQGGLLVIEPQQAMDFAGQFFLDGCNCTITGADLTISSSRFQASENTYFTHQFSTNPAVISGGGIDMFQSNAYFREGVGVPGGADDVHVQRNSSLTVFGGIHTWAGNVTAEDCSLITFGDTGSNGANVGGNTTADGLSFIRNPGGTTTGTTNQVNGGLVVEI